MMEGSGTTAAEATIDNGSFGKCTVRFETGRLVKQAAGPAFAYLDDEATVPSATTAGKSPKDQFDFFPLTVNVEERAYAADRIPGSFFRREGRAGTGTILTARSIDCPLRPGFVKGLRNEVQVVETVLTAHPDDAYDALAINAASMSTQIAGLSFTSLIGGTRLALIDGQRVAFSRRFELERLMFNTVVAGRIVKVEDGSKDVAIMMVEAGDGRDQWSPIQAGALASTGDVVANGLEAAKPFIKMLREAQIEVVKHASKEIAEFPPFIDYTDEQYKTVEGFVGDKFAKALLTEGKFARDEVVDAVKVEMLEGLAEKYPEQEKDSKAAFRSFEKYTIRQHTLREETRMNGRALRQIRSLFAEVEVLPCVHGSALLQCGETQIPGVTTLAMLRMEQQLDNLSPVTAKRHVHQYNFASLSTGETGRVGVSKRREIGYGDLAECVLILVIPPHDEFPYVIRRVSETTGSNGSPSMGSACASTLSLLRAGISLRAPVTGIVVGLMTGEVDGVQKSVTLTDILDVEDGFGDMDFKVAGMKDFIAALQLDTKLDGIDSQVFRDALARARDVRLAILDLINRAIGGPDGMGPNASRAITAQVPADKIGEVTGPKGKMINQIQEGTGANVMIGDDGTVCIASAPGQSAEAARQMINQIASPQMPEAGERFVGTVVETTSFDVLVSLTPGKGGLLHISQVRRLVGGKRIESVEGVLQVSQQVEVEIAEIGDRGRFSLHAVLDEDAVAAEAAGSESMGRTECRECRDHSERRECRPRTRTRRGCEDEEEPASEE